MVEVPLGARSIGPMDERSDLLRIDSVPLEDVRNEIPVTEEFRFAFTEDIVITLDDALGDMHVIGSSSFVEDVLKRMRIWTVAHIVQHPSDLNHLLLMVVEIKRCSHLSG